MSAPYQFVDTGHGRVLTVLTPEQVEVNREGARRLGAALGIGLDAPALRGRRRGDGSERPQYLDVAASRWCSGDWMPAFSLEWDRGPEAAPAQQIPCPARSLGCADLGPELDSCEEEWFGLDSLSVGEYGFRDPKDAELLQRARQLL